MFNFHSKVVDIPQRAAIRACMTSPDDLMSKIDKATTECLGQDDTFDWDDFSELNTVEVIFESRLHAGVSPSQGSDTDGNGLTVNMENAEACFYEALGWLAGDSRVVKRNIIEDFVSLKDAGIRDIFNDDVSKCISWNGNFGPARTKRSADDEEFAEVSF